MNSRIYFNNNATTQVDEEISRKYNIEEYPTLLIFKNNNLFLS